MTKQEFLTAAIKAARESSHVSGLPVGVTVAQAALESAWGQSGLSRNANNYFGIKAHDGHASVAMTTTEVTKGVAGQTVARFAKYRSMQECFSDHDHLILTLPVYADARECASDPVAFMQALARHWATDPNYASKLTKTWRANHLDQIDTSDIRHDYLRAATHGDKTCTVQ